MLLVLFGLSRRGIGGTAIERKTELDSYSRATVIFPRTLEVFGNWSCLGDFLDNGNRVPQIRLESRGDRARIVKFDFADRRDAAGGIASFFPRTSPGLHNAGPASKHGLGRSRRCVIARRENGQIAGHRPPSRSAHLAHQTQAFGCCRRFLGAQLCARREC